jgi:hypothetical protein
MFTIRDLMRNAAGVTLAVMPLFGCATPPERIVATPVPPPERIVATPVPDEIYASNSCPQLKVERAEVAQAVSTLSQQKASDVGAKLGEMKGRLLAIDAVMWQNKCFAG